MKPINLLLHICCAPCAIYTCRELLKDKSNRLTGFYFNPNIYPYEEYSKRRGAVEKYSKDEGIEVIYPEYKPDDFAKRLGRNEDKPMRCRICWQMRLEETAGYAKENGFSAFSTTLLISPYQDHFAIKDIGEELANKFGLEFYYQDFRDGFRQSQEEAARRGLYRQKYCGCKYSLLEAQISTDKRIHR